MAVLKPSLMFGRSRRGIDWCAEDAEPVQLVLLVLSPSVFAPAAHAERVAAAAHALRLQRMRHKLLEAAGDAVRALLAEVPE